MKKENNKNIINQSNITVGGDFHLGDKINVDKIKDTNSIIDTDSTLSTLKALIAQHKIKKVLELLLAKKDLDNDLTNEIVAQANRWNRIQREIRQGIISEADREVIQNRLTKSLLEIIDELED